MAIRQHRPIGASTLWLLGLLACTLGGCMTGLSSDISDIVFSPDGRRVAFIKDEWAGLGHVFVLGCGCTKNAVFCADVDSPQKLHRLHVSSGMVFAAFAREAQSTVEVARHIAFSPDGNCLAIEAGDSLKVLDVSSGKAVWSLKIESGCFYWAWYSKDQLAWCQATDRPNDSYDVRIMRQKVVPSPTSGKDTAEVREAAEELAKWTSPGPCFEANWSPSGRYVLVAGIGDPSPARILDLRTRQVHEVSSGSTIVRGVSWRTDESAVLVSLELNRAELLFSLLMKTIAPESGIAWRHAGNSLVMIELPACQIDTWKVGGDYTVGLSSPVWTHDNRFVPSTGNGSKSRAMLIEPTQRRFLEIPKPLYARLNVNDVELRAMPVPGWLRARNWEGHSFAFDYSATTFVPLAEHAFAISPDGKLLAEVGDWGRLIVRPLKLPALPAGQPASAPSGQSPDARATTKPFDSR